MSADLSKDSYSTVANGTGGSAAACTGIAEPLFHLDKTWQITDANAAAQSLLARYANPVVGASARSIFPDAFGALFNRHCERALRFGVQARFEEQYLPKDTWLEVLIYPTDSGATVLMHDAADRRQDATLVEDQSRILEQMARGQTSRDVLDSITGLAERHGSALLVGVFANSASPDVLRLAAGPSFPADYLHDIEHLLVRPDGSPVGQAAFQLKPVIVTDLLLESCETKFREAASRHGLRSCWALPIISTDQTRLGVLAVYRREPSRPSQEQLRLLQTSANLAGIALERQRVDESLRQKEQEYRSIVETVQDVLVVADMEGHIVEVNPAASRVLRASYDQLIGRQAMDMVRPDYHGVIRRMLDEVRQGREYQAAVAGIRSDRSSFPAEITAAPFIYKNQRHLLAVVRDVTSRKKMEDSLRKTEESLRTVANGAPVVLFSLDKAGVFTLSEGQALASMGLRPGEMVGQNALEIYADHPEIVNRLKQALAGEPSRYTAELNERVYETIVRPLRSHNGEIIGAVGMAIDTTEQALTAEALMESEDRFRASFQQAPLGSAHASLDGIVLRANEPLAELLGVPAQEIVGQRLRDWLTTPEEQAADSAAVQQLLATQSSRSSARRLMRNAAGQTFPVVVSLSIIKDRHGEAKHLVYALTPLP